MTLLSLIQTLFEKQPVWTTKGAKTFRFQDIASAIQMNVTQVEYVLIRAMSLGLIQGSIDQVEEIVKITHVMPRTLNKKQIQHMKFRYEEWNQSIGPVSSLLSL